MTALGTQVHLDVAGRNADKVAHDLLRAWSRCEARRVDDVQGRSVRVVVDDGHSTVTPVWTVYPAWRGGGQCERGDVVRLKGYRWCRYARKVTVLRPATAPAAAADV